VLAGAGEKVRDRVRADRELEDIIVAAVVAIRDERGREAESALQRVLGEYRQRRSQVQAPDRRQDLDWAGRRIVALSLKGWTEEDLLEDLDKRLRESKGGSV
jgi:hypothetical protein